MKDWKSIWIALFVAGCILLNCAGKYLANTLQLPIWMDCVGTILTAYCLGPVCGAIVGASGNMIYGFSDSTAYVYALTSILLGILFGICARRNMFRDVFGTLTVGFFAAMVSVCVSSPLNHFFFEGYPGNVWGNAVVDFLQEQGCHRLFCEIAGEFYVDFLDKVLLLGVLHVCILAHGAIKKRRRKPSHKMEKNKSVRKAAEKNTGKETMVGMLLVFLLIGAAMCSEPATAEAKYTTEQQKENNYNDYVQTIYDGDNGLPSGTATDIAQTNDGDLWIGTYNGLYRYNGTQFQWMDDFDSVKNVNCPELFTVLR